ncbi:MAG TPA: pyridoxamine 5'-phosphate oxidase [Stellaceae bacterium]|nr:pyridoxamine 5'-phosphate oxidase [Stellaceae bacterium]
MIDEISEPEPLVPFRRWFAEASERERDPTAMALATTAPDGRPSLRFVLLKGFDERGFVFYTNLDSRKAEELSANPRAALCFFWPNLRRQVRIEGAAAPASAAEADAYFASRPRDSQLGAWASEQSRPLADRAQLEHRAEEVARRFAGQEVARPPFWSGFRVAPERVEFWQERPSRLHDRWLYIREGETWRRQRLYP